jgi:hypothetical protein
LARSLHHRVDWSNQGRQPVERDALLVETLRINRVAWTFVRNADNPSKWITFEWPIVQSGNADHALKAFLL